MMVCRSLSAHDIKTPPQPLPTRGRGYCAMPFHANLILAVRRTITACEILASDRHRGLRLSRSPLWGGVGEGSFPLSPIERPA
ncbi:hypothetical protein ELI30_22175 [Rhizobium leguminosarum]|nr:hypothetical protein ELI32_22870 [Rhizobium leguminosarum]TAV60197.1 hypothetical protein ELI31_21395 [Rhizobium leguminosarum]TAV71244.1 hypothetical protein ELI30_22175 [Rhizobium leguminosarum]TAY68878.1 hypothetical protein ELH82_23160 [Rhizobium leguminosarum]